MSNSDVEKSLRSGFKHNRPQLPVTIMVSINTTSTRHVEYAPTRTIQPKNIIVCSLGRIIQFQQDTTSSSRNQGAGLFGSETPKNVQYTCGRRILCGPCYETLQKLSILSPRLEDTEHPIRPSFFQRIAKCQRSNQETKYD